MHNDHPNNKSMVVIYSQPFFLCEIDLKAIDANYFLSRLYLDVKGGCIDDPGMLSVLSHYMSKIQNTSAIKNPIKLIAVGELLWVENQGYHAN